MKDNAEPLFRETLVPGMTLVEVIAWAKRNPEEMKKSEMGRAILALIKKGDTKTLARYWMGKRGGFTDLLRL